MKFFQENTHILSAAVISDLQCTAWSVDSSVALQPFGYMLSSVVAGIFGDLIGMRTILLGGLGTACVSACCISYTNEIATIKIARFLLGIGLGAINCCAYALMKHVGKDSSLKSTISGSYIALFLSAAFYPILTRSILSCGYSWRWIMFTGGGIAAVLTVVLLCMLPSIYTKPESIQAYCAHAWTLVVNPAFVRCCVVACMTMGHTYVLQALITAYKRDLIAEVSFDQPVLQFVARLCMVAGALYANRSNTNLDRMSYRGAAWIVGSCTVMTIAIVANDLLGGNVTTARVMMWMLRLGFAASYAFIGIAQTAAKTEMLLLAGSFPGIAQGIASTAASGWEALGVRVVYGITWPVGAACYFAILLFGMALVHKLLCATRAKDHSAQV